MGKAIPLKQASYRDRDYAFGQAVLALRSNLGLTQTELARLLGISRFALGGWEAGDKYPKYEHLKHFITIAVQRKAFPSGHELEEIRALWELAHQKVSLDEHWLASLLSADIQVPVSEMPAFSPTISTPSTPRLDWGDALATPSFYGRQNELSVLTKWVLKERCRVISVVGFGGIGKSALVVQLMYQIANHFQVVIWRSLRAFPRYELLLDDCLQALTPQLFGELPVSLEERQRLLLKWMRTTRTLLVLDNLESILEQGESAGCLRPEYQHLGRILDLSAETEHQSCLLLTSREKPINLLSHEGNQSPVRTLRLTQLDGDACNRLLTEKEVAGSESERAKLTESYEGNPLALKIVARTIVELFNGEITPFLEQGEVIFGGVRQLLNEQIARLSRMEQDVLIWLAILREPSTLDHLRTVMVRPTASIALLEALESLSRRSLIERGQARGSFSLQSVVLEYVTSRLITELSDEIERGQLDRLLKYGLELAHTQEYVRQIESLLIAAPILSRLRSIYAQQPRLEEHLLALLKSMSDQPEESQGYAPANLLVLLRLLRGHLRGVDLSHLVLRDLDLQGIEMQDASLANATIHNSFFTETFDALTSVAISGTGEYWAAASRRGEIRIWEAKGQSLYRAWRGHTTTTWSLAFSPDGYFLVSGSNDGALKMWEVSSGRLLWSNRHANDVNRLSFSPEGHALAGAAFDSGVFVWDVANGALLQTLPHPNSVASVVWSPDGQLLASGDVEGCIRLWAVDQIGQTQPLQTWPQHAGCADGLAFAPNSRSLASASWDGTVKLWEIPTGRLLQTLKGHTDRVGRVMWSPDGSLIASSSADQIILLWDVEQGIYRGALKGHTSDVYEIAFTPDSRRLMSSSRDGSLRVWDVASEQCIRIIHGYAASIYDVDWSSDNRQLVSGGTDLLQLVSGGTELQITVWDVDTGIPFQVLQEHTGFVRAVGWSPNNRWLASSDTEYGIRLWDLTSSENFRYLRYPDNSGNFLYNLAWHPDSKQLASGTHLHGVKVWDVDTGQESWIGHQSPTWFPVVSWSPDGTRLAGGSADGSVYIWNVTEDSLEYQLTGHHSRIMSLAWSPDGTPLASGARGVDGGELFVWDIQLGQPILNIAAHTSVVAAVTWNLNGDRLISGGGHGTLRWWDVHTGECLLKREAHVGSIRALRRSPDGTMLASCGDDGAIMLWDLSTGEHLKTIRRDRPYERLDITGIRGLSEAQKATLRALGAIEDDTAQSSAMLGNL